MLGYINIQNTYVMLCDIIITFNIESFQIRVKKLFNWIIIQLQIITIVDVLETIKMHD